MVGPLLIGGALVAFVALGALAARRGLLRRRRRESDLSGDLPGIWLIVAGAAGLLVATIVFAACSIDGYEGDPGPVVTTVFDVSLWGGGAALLVGVLWSAA